MGIGGERHEGIVLVTGGSGHLGQVVIEQLLKREYRVGSLDRVVPEFRDRHLAYTTVELSDPTATRLAVADLVNDHKLRSVISLVGGAVPAEYETDTGGWPSVNIFRDSLEQNLVSQYVVTTAVAPYLVRGGSGDRSLVYCGSINAQGVWSKVAYSAAKAGLEALTRVGAARLGLHGVRVAAVAAGTIVPAKDASVDEELMRQLVNTVPLGRLADPAEVAKVLIGVAIDFHHVTGQVFNVDGGQSIQRGFHNLDQYLERGSEL